MLDDSYIELTDHEFDRPGIIRGELKRNHRMMLYLTKPQIVIKAEGVNNLLSYVAEAMPEPREGEASSKISDGGDFNALRTYEDAMDTFRNHPEKLVTFDPAEFRIKDDTESGSAVDYEVVGDYIDMGRYMEGVPETWGSMRNGNARNRRVTLIVNTTNYWGVEHKDITHKGERILRLVDALESGGVRTEIIAIESSGCAHTEILVKRHDEPLTISDLAVVTHPEFLRRVNFRIVEYSRNFSFGYGDAVVHDKSVESHPELLHFGSNDEIVIHIGGNMEGISNIDKLFDQLERLVQWEMSKSVPEVEAIHAGKYGIKFSPNGMRSSNEIRREGLEVINQV